MNSHMRLAYTILNPGPHNQFYKYWVYYYYYDGLGFLNTWAAIPHNGIESRWHQRYRYLGGDLTGGVAQQVNAEVAAGHRWAPEELSA